MTPTVSYSISIERACHKTSIEALHESVFGPGRYTRTAFRVREGCSADTRFCFVALSDDLLVGSVRLTRVQIGGGQAYLLGPLCVVKSLQGSGIGKTLVAKVLEAVHHEACLPVILVGDASYYGPLGFRRAPKTIKMPGPVDYARLLIAWPEKEDRQADYTGMMRCTDVC